MKLGDLLGIGFVLLVAGLCFACEVHVWNECRVQHSWAFCWRMLG